MKFQQIRKEFEGKSLSGMGKSELEVIKNAVLACDDVAGANFFSWGVSGIVLYVIKKGCKANLEEIREKNFIVEIEAEAISTDKSVHPKAEAE